MATKRRIIYEYILSPCSDNEAIKLTIHMTLPFTHMANYYAITSNQLFEPLFKWKIILFTFQINFESFLLFHSCNYKLNSFFAPFQTIFPLYMTHWHIVSCDWNCTQFWFFSLKIFFFSISEFQLVIVFVASSNKMGNPIFPLVVGHCLCGDIFTGIFRTLKL